MRILIACEESQTVCMAFRRIGHEAYSCDIKDCSGGFPQYHIKGDALSAARSGNWDMIIAHPPCTFLSRVGAPLLYRPGGMDRDRLKKGLKAAEFFRAFLEIECKYLCVENPVPLACFELPPATQYIEPYYFGDPYSKKTGLWLRGLPPLQQTNPVKPVVSWVVAHKSPRIRSKTFEGVAAAMADQWGCEFPEYQYCLF